MKNPKLVFIIFALFSISINSYAQNGPPPPPAEPTSKNAKLIDEIIILSKYEEYFKICVYNAISKIAIEKKWSDEKIKAQRKIVNFDDFKETIYNNCAFYTPEELLLLKKFYTSLNKRNRNDTLIFISPMIQSNLEVYISRFSDN
jgi:hypothetical protein